ARDRHRRRLRGFSHRARDGPARSGTWKVSERLRASRPSKAPSPPPGLQRARNGPVRPVGPQTAGGGGAYRAATPSPGRTTGSGSRRGCRRDGRPLPATTRRAGRTPDPRSRRAGPGAAAGSPPACRGRPGTAARRPAVRGAGSRRGGVRRGRRRRGSRWCRGRGRSRPVCRRRGRAALRCGGRVVGVVGGAGVVGAEGAGGVGGGAVAARCPVGGGGRGSERGRGARGVAERRLPSAGTAAPGGLLPGVVGGPRRLG